MITKIALKIERLLKQEELTDKELIFIFNIIWNMTKDRGINLKI